jgi:hypothetical protein
MYVAKLKTSDVTANMIASIGRENKAQLTKKYSSLGRMLMKKDGAWSGIKVL